MRFAAAVAIVVAGCANAALPSRQLANAEAAGAELKSAGEVLERALAARDTLDDPAVVDHLAYLATQRVAISIEVAKGKALQREALDRQRAARIAARR